MPGSSNVVSLAATADEDCTQLPFAAVPKSAVHAGSRYASGGGGGYSCSHTLTEHPSVAQYDDTPCAAERAYHHANTAEECLAAGDLEGALTNHLQAAKAFVEAAEGVTDAETATALLFLSQAHARQAQDLKMCARVSPKVPPVDEAATLQQQQRTPTGAAAAASQLSAGAAATAKLPSPLEDSILASTLLPRPPQQQEQPHLRTRVQDMLELERRLALLGIGGTTARGGSGGGDRPAHVPPSTRYLASTLGESFCLLNRSMGPGALLGGSVYAAAVGSDATRPLFPLPPPALGAVRSIGGGAAAASAFAAAAGPVLRVPSAAAAAGGGSQMGGRAGAAAQGVLGGLDGAQSQSEIMRLLQCMRTLGEENAALLRECEEGRRGAAAAAAAREDVAAFQAQYAQRFRLLRKALGEFQQRYPAARGAIGGDVGGGGAESAARVQELERQVEALNARVARCSELLKRKDVMLERYEQWYRTLKANARSKQKAQSSATSSVSGGPPAANPPAPPQDSGINTSMPPPPPVRRSSLSVAPAAAAAAAAAEASAPTATASAYRPVQQHTRGSREAGVAAALRPPPQL